MKAIEKYPALFTNNDNEFGCFDYEGRHYTLVLRQAYCDTDRNGDWIYSGDAICAQDEIDEEEGVTCYSVTWYPTEEGMAYAQEYGDESDVCDWDDPDEVREIGSVYYLDEGRIV